MALRFRARFEEKLAREVLPLAVQYGNGARWRPFGNLHPNAIPVSTRVRGNFIPGHL